MSKRVLIILGIGAAFIVGAFLLLKYELTPKAEEYPAGDPDETEKTSTDNQEDTKTIVLGPETPINTEKNEPGSLKVD